MKYTSTRDTSLQVTFSNAILDGIAPDGGLYVPQDLPIFDPSEFSETEPQNWSKERYLGNNAKYYSCRSSDSSSFDNTTEVDFHPVSLLVL